MNDKLEQLYKALQSDPNYKGVGSSFDSFKTFMQKDENALKVYGSLLKDPKYKGVGSSFDSFKSGFGLTTQTEPNTKKKSGGESTPTSGLASASQLGGGSSSLASNQSKASGTNKLGELVSSMITDENSASNLLQKPRDPSQPISENNNVRYNDVREIYEYQLEVNGKSFTVRDKDKDKLTYIDDYLNDKLPTTASEESKKAYKDQLYQAYYNNKVRDIETKALQRAAGTTEQRKLEETLSDPQKRKDYTYNLIQEIAKVEDPTIKQDLLTFHQKDIEQIANHQTPYEKRQLEAKEREQIQLSLQGKTQQPNLEGITDDPTQQKLDPETSITLRALFSDEEDNLLREALDASIWLTSYGMVENEDNKKTREEIEEMLGGVTWGELAQYANESGYDEKLSQMTYSGQKEEFNTQEEQYNFLLGFYNKKINEETETLNILSARSLQRGLTQVEKEQAKKATKNSKLLLEQTKNTYNQFEKKVQKDTERKLRDQNYLEAQQKDVSDRTLSDWGTIASENVNEVINGTTKTATSLFTGLFTALQSASDVSDDLIGEDNIYNPFAALNYWGKLKGEESYASKVYGDISNLFDNYQQETLNINKVERALSNEYLWKTYNGKRYKVSQTGVVIDEQGNVIRDEELEDSVKQAQTEKVESNRDFSALPSIITNQAVQMASATTIGSGGFSKAAGYALMSFKSNYDTYKEAFPEATPTELFLYATTTSAVEGAMERIMPDEKYFGAGGISKQVLRSAFRGASKTGRSASIRAASSDYATKVILENIEEQGASVAISTINAAVNQVKSQSKLNDSISKEEAVDTFIITSLFSGLMGLPSSLQTYSLNRNVQTAEDAKVYIANNQIALQRFDEIVATPGIRESFNGIEEIRNEIYDIKKYANKAPNNLTSTQYKEIIPLLKKKEELQEEKKSTDEAFHDDINEEISSINQQIKEKVSRRTGDDPSMATEEVRIRRGVNLNAQTGSEVFTEEEITTTTTEESIETETPTTEVSEEVVEDLGEIETTEGGIETEIPIIEVSEDEIEELSSVEVTEEDIESPISLLEDVEIDNQRAAELGIDLTEDTGQETEMELPEIDELETEPQPTTERETQEDATPQQPKERVVSPLGIGNESYKKEEGHVVGRARTITTPSGKKVKGRYKLVEAEQVVASHNETTFSKDERFPTDENGETINDRDYEANKDYQTSVIMMGQNFDSRAVESPPITTQDGIVLSGNNRVMSRKRAAKSGTDSEYIQSLKEDAEIYGIDHTQVDGMTNPTIVFETEDSVDYNTSTMAEFNKRAEKPKTFTDKAVELSKTLTDKDKSKIAEIYAEVETPSEATSNPKNAKALLKVLLDSGIIPEIEIPQYFDTSKGVMTPDGVRLMEQVALGAAFDVPTIKTLSIQGMGNVKNAMLKGLVGLLNNSGMAQPYQLTKDITKAIEVIYKSKASNLSISDYIAQPDIFGEKMTPTINEYAAIIALSGKPTEFKSWLNNYNKDIGQPNMFNETGVTEKEDILHEQVKNKAGNKVFEYVQQLNEDTTSADAQGDGETTKTQRTQDDLERLSDKQSIRLLSILNKAFPNIGIEFFEEEAQPTSNGNLIKMPNGRLMGFVADGKVFINASWLNANTPIHEYSHIFTELLKQQNPEIHADLIELIKQDDALMDEIRNDPNYEKIKDNDDAVADEAFARIMGDAGESQFLESIGKDKTRVEKIKSLINKLWESLKAMFGREVKSSKKWDLEDFQYATLEEIVENTTKEMLKGKNFFGEATTEKIGEVREQIAEGKDEQLNEQEGSISTTNADIRYSIVSESENSKSESEKNIQNLSSALKRLKTLNDKVKINQRTAIDEIIHLVPKGKKRDFRKLFIAFKNINSSEKSKKRAVEQMEKILENRNSKRDALLEAVDDFIKKYKLSDIQKREMNKIITRVKNSSEMSSNELDKAIDDINDIVHITDFNIYKKDFLNILKKKVQVTQSGKAKAGLLDNKGIQVFNQIKALFSDYAKDLKGKKGTDREDAKLNFVIKLQTELTPLIDKSFTDEGLTQQEERQLQSLAVTLEYVSADLKGSAINKSRKMADAYNELKMIYDGGRTRRQEWLDNRKARFQDYRKQGIAETNPKGEAIPFTYSQLKKLPSKFRERFARAIYTITFKAQTDQVETWLRLISNKGASDLWGGYFLGLANKYRQSETNKMTAIREEAENLFKAAKSIYGLGQTRFEVRMRDSKDFILTQKNVTPEEMVDDSIPYDEYAQRIETLKRDEMIYLWMNYKNVEERPSFEEAGYTEEIMQEIEDFLSAEDKEFAYYLFAFYEKKYEELNKVHLDLNGVELPKSEFYAGYLMKSESSQTTAEQQRGLFSTFQSMRTGSVQSKSQKTRTGVVSPIIPISAIAAFTQYSRDTNHTIHFAKIYEEFNAVFNNNTVKANIQAMNPTFGKMAINSITTFITDNIEQGGKMHSLSMKTINEVYKFYVEAKLFAKPKVGLTQLLSIVNSFSKLWNYNPIDIYNGLKNLPQEIKYLNNNSNYIKNRKDYKTMLAALTNYEEVRSSSGIPILSDSKITPYLRMLGRVKSNIGGAYISIGDRIGILGGSLVYSTEKQKQLRLGNSEDFAIKKAVPEFEAEADRTQQPQSAIGKTFIQTHPILSKIIPFQSSPTQMWNNIFINSVELKRHLQGKGKGGKMEIITNIINYGTIQPTAYAAAGQASLQGLWNVGNWIYDSLDGDDEDDEELTEQGKGIMSALIGNQYTSTPILGPAYLMMVDRIMLDKDYSFGDSWSDIAFAKPIEVLASGIIAESTSGDKKETISDIRKRVNSGTYKDGDLQKLEKHERKMWENTIELMSGVPTTTLFRYYDVMTEWEDYVDHYGNAGVTKLMLGYSEYVLKLEKKTPPDSQLKKKGFTEEEIEHLKKTKRLISKIKTEKLTPKQIKVIEETKEIGKYMNRFRYDQVTQKDYDNLNNLIDARFKAGIYERDEVSKRRKQYDNIVVEQNEYFKKMGENDKIINLKPRTRLDTQKRQKRKLPPRIERNR